MPSDSILVTVRESLGLQADDDNSFSDELIMLINSSLADFAQLGVGPSTGFSITGEEETWDDLLGGDPRLNNVQSLLFLKVKMLHDPPETGYLVTSYEKLIEKAEWRVMIAADEIINPWVEPVEEIDDIWLDAGDV